jgi:hypothetical protein
MEKVADGLDGLQLIVEVWFEVEFHDPAITGFSRFPSRAAEGWR